MLIRPITCYIFKKQGAQGYQIWHLQWQRQWRRRRQRQRQKCWNDSIYAKFLKSRGYKDIKYDRIGGLLIPAMPESTRLFPADPFPKRFMEISITTDGFHENNHTNCSSAFRNSNYCSLKHVNTEAAEQTNKVLRTVTNSTTFMSPKLYMKALTLFMANLKILAKQKK